MADEIIKRDQNFKTVAAGVSNDAGQDILIFRVDPITGYLLANITDTGSSSANSSTVAKRDGNYRPVCLAYNELTGETEEILTDSSGNLLCDVTFI